MATFHKNDVQVGQVYLMKVSNTEVPVLIVRAFQDRGKQNRTQWKGRNLKTNREVTIKSAAKLRAYIAPTDYERYGLTV